MKLFKFKKKKEETLIGDEGVEAVKDPVGVIAIVFCNTVVVLLIVLAVLAFM